MKEADGNSVSPSENLWRSIVPIEIKGLTVTHLHAEQPALADVTLEIPEGQVTAIVGPTGAGKSTLLLCLNQLVPAEIPAKIEGTITIDGRDIHGARTADLARSLVLLFEDPALQIVSLTVEDDVAFGPANFGLPPDEIRARVAQAVRQMRLSGYELRNPRTLSGGEQQLLALAGILAMRPKYIAMDEPVAMLDPIGKAQVLEAVRHLRDHGTSIIITDSGSDIEDLCTIADSMVVLHKGRVVAKGTPGEIFAQKQLVQEVGLRIPQVARLAWSLAELDGASAPATVVPTKLEEGIDLVKGFLQKIDANAPAASAATAKQDDSAVQSAVVDEAVHVSNLKHVFPGPPPVEALRGVSLSVPRGETLGIIGQNGSGKTTLSFHLVGVYQPSNPEAVVVVDGVDVVHAPQTETIRHVNYVFQNPANQLFCETFGEEVCYGPTCLGLNPQDAQRCGNEALEKVGLGPYKDYPTLGNTRAVESLLALASIVAMKTKVLVVDEPSGGLDHLATQRVLRILDELRSSGVTVIIVSHDMELVAHACDHVAVMKEGCILLQGRTREVFNQPEALQKAYLLPPQVTRIAQVISHPAVPRDLLTVEEMVSTLTQLKNASRRS
jgi:energy-coupling factor transporter ATP-binding protein EcfA2